MVSDKTRQVVKQIIKQLLGFVLVLEIADPVAAAIKLNSAWQLQVDVAGRYVELLTPSGCALGT
jgi:hypothetical protein